VNILQVVKKELLRYKIETNKFEILSNKDGVLVVRLEDLGYVFKMFFSQYSREIDIYILFNRLGIKTARVIEFKEHSILLEDVSKSDYYRMATQEDLKDERVIKAIAKWYQLIHKRGYRYFINNENKDFYSEIDDINIDEINMVRERSGYTDQEFWSLLVTKMPLIKKYVKRNRTFNYNEFSFKNLVVSKNYDDAFMIDFNLVGWGLSYVDYRRITENPDVKTEHYPILDNFLDLKDVDNDVDTLVSALFALIDGYRRGLFANWAAGSLDKLKDGTLKKSLVSMIEKFDSYEEKEVLKIADGDLIIRNAKVSDIDQLSSWWADGKVMEHAGFPNGIKSDKEILKGDLVVDNVSGLDNLRLVIEKDNLPIGEMNYRLTANRVYEIGIKICEEEYQDKGIGSRAINLLLDFLVNEMRARRIALDTTPENTRARATYEKLGFVQTEVKNNSWTDQLGNKRSSVHYELNVDDFKSIK
jgi:RimJ/RimL family protein N-acetyltransferase